MSGTNYATERRRKARYLRGLRGEKKHAAVSPVVATLILILIAVAAAAALYLWLVVWQGNITGGIGNQGAQSTLTIGGSTSVYPFDAAAVTQFEQNNTDVVISNNQGGSGAGMFAVCSGAVDLGAASFPVDVATLESSYACPSQYASTIVVTTVAYDAVDVIVSSTNNHGLLSINFDTYALIYQDASYAAGGTPTLLTLTENGVTISTLLVAIPVNAAIEWQQLPGAVAGATIGGTLQTPITSAGATAGAACGPGALANTECYPVAASASTCGWTVCATGAQAVTTVARSDASGTTQSFEARLIEAESSKTFATAAQLNAPTTGFSGCGSTNYIADCGYVATTTGNGNPGVISATSGSANSIAYASDGLARASGSGVTIIPFMGAGQTVATDGSSTNPTWYGAILPTTGGSGTIALGIQAPTKSADYATGFLGWRPFDLVSLTSLSGVAERFIQFTLDPANNINLASETQEISVYSV
jgi:ABC-type phosphate transport system substrate-binding protein